MRKNIKVKFFDSSFLDFTTDVLALLYDDEDVEAIIDAENNRIILDRRNFFFNEDYKAYLTVNA